MELREYISETLKQIITGVEESQKFAREHSAVINGDNWSFYTREALSSPIYTDNNGKIVQVIEFTVQVSTKENDTAQGGFGIFVGPVASGAKGQRGSENSSMNLLKFNIPLMLPRQKQGINT